VKGPSPDQHAQAPAYVWTRGIDHLLQYLEPPDGCAIRTNVGASWNPTSVRVSDENEAAGAADASRG